MKGNMVSPHQRQHYVSKFYLAFFRSSHQQGKVPLVWVYDKERSQPRLESVRRAAVEIDLNTLEIDGQSNTELESLLADLESRVKPVFERWQQKGDRAELRDIELVAEFLALQYLRVPRSLNLVNEVAVSSAHEWMDGLRDNPENLKSLWDRMAQDGNVPEGLSLDSIGRSLENVQHRPVVTLKRWAAVCLSIFQSEEIASLLVSMNWRLMRATESMNFITSDCPVCPCVIEERRAKFGSLFDHPRVEVTFPLSPQVCLVLSRKESFLGALSDGIALREVNRRTAFMAERFVYARQRSKGVQDLVSHFSYTRRSPKIGNVCLS
jgi:hypothetical protein